MYIYLSIERSKLLYKCLKKRLGSGAVINGIDRAVCSWWKLPHALASSTNFFTAQGWDFSFGRRRILEDDPTVPKDFWRFLMTFQRVFSFSVKHFWILKSKDVLHHTWSHIKPITTKAGVKKKKWRRMQIQNSVPWYVGCLWVTINNMRNWNSTKIIATSLW